MEEQEARRLLDIVRRLHDSTKVRALMKTTREDEALQAALEAVRDEGPSAVPDQYREAFFVGYTNALRFTMDNAGAGMWLMERIAEDGDKGRSRRTTVFEFLWYIAGGGAMPASADILMTPLSVKKRGTSALPWVVCGFVMGWEELVRYLNTGEEGSLLIEAMSAFKVGEIGPLPDEVREILGDSY